MDAHRQRVAAARDAMERAGVAASDARQYVAEREAAAEQAQVRGCLQLGRVHFWRRTTRLACLCRSAGAAPECEVGAPQLPTDCFFCWKISFSVFPQAAHKAASHASIQAQNRMRQLEGELRRLQASQGGWRVGGAGG